MSEHRWRLIIETNTGDPSGSSDKVEQCSCCSVVRHTYSYSTEARRMSHVREFFLGEIIPPLDECPGLLRMLPALTVTESTAEPLL